MQSHPNTRGPETPVVLMGRKKSALFCLILSHSQRCGEGWTPELGLIPFRFAPWSRDGRRRGRQRRAGRSCGQNPWVHSSEAAAGLARGNCQQSGARTGETAEFLHLHVGASDLHDSAVSPPCWCLLRTGQHWRLNPGAVRSGPVGYNGGTSPGWMVSVPGWIAGRIYGEHIASY